MSTTTQASSSSALCCSHVFTNTSSFSLRGQPSSSEAEQSAHQHAPDSELSEEALEAPDTDLVLARE